MKNKKYAFFIIIVIMAVMSLSHQSAHAAKVVAQWEIPRIVSGYTAQDVQNILENIDGVLRVDITYKSHKALVMFDDSKTSVRNISQVLRNKNYPPKGKVKIITDSVPET